MKHCIVVGAQWGDEGKAKVIDYLTQRSDVVIRFQGGANAGHTVIADGRKFVFHMVPSGVMYPGKICIVGNGVVVDVEQFFKEVDELASCNISLDGRLFVSDLAHLVLPYHKIQDGASELSMGKKKIGTTKRGIGPAYADKAARNGLRVGDLRDWDGFVAKLRAGYEHKKTVVEKLFGGSLNVNADEIIDQYRGYRDRLLPMVNNTAHYLFEAHRQGKRLLFEGAQGTFLDVDHGTYPFVTSSNTVAGAVCTGGGIGPTLIGEVVGIVKAYTTRVGNGPFPAELNDELGEQLRKEGDEFGATTGRPRRCGWFDSVMIRKAVELNGLTKIALTKLDVLNTFDEIKICTHYRIDGEKIEDFPTDPQMLERAEPVWETLPGWKQDIRSARSFADLPGAAQAYVNRLRELCYDIPLLMISVGPDRKETMEIEPV